MFRMAAAQLRTWWSISTADILGGDLESEPIDYYDVDPRHDLSPKHGAVYPHTHRTPLRLQRERRPGTVQPRPAICISPVRAR
jgi:hypothetical protein